MPTESLLMNSVWYQERGEVWFSALALSPHMYVTITIAGSRFQTVHRPMIQYTDYSNYNDESTDAIVLSSVVSWESSVGH